MLSLDVPEEKARALVTRVVQEYSLDAEQDATLNQLVTNFAKVHVPAGADVAAAPD
jgi:hypothetical protein